MPADIALDEPYLNELLRREALLGLPAVPKTLQNWDQAIVAGASSTIFVIPKLSLSDLKAYEKPLYPFIRQACLARKTQRQ